MSQTAVISFNVADLVDPNDPDGRSYRQVNAANSHNIPIGALVELDTGMRLFVVFQGRDCDQTPLYYLSPESDDTEQDSKMFRNPLWVGGYLECSLKVVRLPI